MKLVTKLDNTILDFEKLGISIKSQFLRLMNWHIIYPKYLLVYMYAKYFETHILTM